MAIPTSTAPAVKTWLYNLLVANLTPSPGSRLRVFYNDPGTDLPDDVVSVSNVLNRTTTYAAFVGGGGANYLDETYTIEIVIDAYRGGDNAITAEARAWVLEGAIEQLIRGDLTAGGTAGVFDLRPGAVSAAGTWSPDHLGHTVRLTLAVDVGARI